MSADCCTNTFDLGCVYCNQVAVELPVVATVTGTYTAVFRYLGRSLVFEFQGTLGQPLMLPLNGLNPSFRYWLHVLDPNGDRVTYISSGTVFDCFKLRTHPKLIGQVVLVPLSGITCANLLDPVNGLTELQRNGCILPTYDFTDLDTQTGVTLQQRADLIAWLCDGGPVPTLCELVEAASAAEIVACVPSGNRPVLFCALLATDEVTPEVIVVCLDGAGKTDAVRAIICTPCDPVNIRNTADDSTLATAAAGSNWPLPRVLVYIELSDGTIIEAVYPVTALVGGGSQQQINLQLNRVAVHSTDGTTLLFYADPQTQIDVPALGLRYLDADGITQQDSKPIVALSGGLQSTGETLPRFRVFLSDEATLYLTGDITAPDVILAGVELRNSAADVLSHHEDGTIAIAPDASVQRVDSAAANIGSAIAVPSGASTNVICPDGTANALNSASTNVGSASVKSNGSANINVADSTITKPDGTTVGLPATVALDVRGYRSGIVYNNGFILASGQTTVHRTGDEGTMRSLGRFTYVRPIYPVSFAELSTFTVLASNNSFGNTLRFTDASGSAAATTGDRLILDHWTGWAYWRPGSLPAFSSWNDAIDAAEASTAGGFTDWHLPTDRLLDTITNDSLASSLNYGAFLITTPLWTATTRPDDSTIARVFRPDIGSLFGNLAKTATTTCSYILCRRFAA